MSNVNFSQRSVFYLNQLSNAVFKQTARRFRLTEEGSVQELIHFAAQIKDDSIRRFRNDFIQTIPNEDLARLQ